MMYGWLMRLALVDVPVENAKPAPARKRYAPGDHFIFESNRGGRVERQRILLVAPCEATDEWRCRLVSGDGILSDETKISMERLEMNGKPLYERGDIIAIEEAPPIPTRGPLPMAIARYARKRLKPGMTL